MTSGNPYGVRRLDAVLDPLSSGLTRKPAQSKGDAITCGGLDHRDRNSAVENGVEPPYSISEP